MTESLPRSGVDQKIHALDLTLYYTYECPYLFANANEIFSSLQREGGVVTLYVLVYYRMFCTST